VTDDRKIAFSGVEDRDKDTEEGEKANWELRCQYQQRTRRQRPLAPRTRSRVTEREREGKRTWRCQYQLGASPLSASEKPLIISLSGHLHRAGHDRLCQQRRASLTGTQLFRGILRQGGRLPPSSLSSVQAPPKNSSTSSFLDLPTSSQLPTRPEYLHTSHLHSSIIKRTKASQASSALQTSTSCLPKPLAQLAKMTVPSDSRSWSYFSLAS
jgi:hypothetical protein